MMVSIIIGQNFAKSELLDRPFHSGALTKDHLCLILRVVVKGVPPPFTVSNKNAVLKFFYGQPHIDH